MSSFTVTNFRTELRTHLGVDSTDLPNADADLLLNRSKWQMEEELDLHQNKIHTTFNTVDGTFSYAQAFPIEVIETLALNDLDSEKFVPLFPISEDDYNSIYSTDVEQEGKPEKYFMRGSNLILWPTPDDAYEIQVTRKEILDDLSDSVTTISTSRALQEIILIGAVMRGFQRMRDFNSFYRTRDIYNGLIRTYQTRDVKEQDNWHYAQVNPILNKYEPN